MAPNISHYCQKCLAANPLGQEFCSRCGTRLMIIVEPTSSRFETGTGAVSTDEHLLERISAAENRVSRLAERLERSLDLLLRYAQNAYFDRSLIRALVGLLTEDGIVETERLERMWSERCQRDSVEQEESVHRDELRTRIIAATNLADKQVFEQLINEGFVLLEDKQIPQGIIKLQRAAELHGLQTPVPGLQAARQRPRHPVPGLGQPQLGLVLRDRHRHQAVKECGS